VSVSQGHILVWWTLPPWHEAENIEVANNPGQASDGSFFPENIVVSDYVAQDNWTSGQMKPGTYYVHVSAYACKPDDGGCAYEEWSNVVQVDVPGPLTCQIRGSIDHFDLSAQADVPSAGRNITTLRWEFGDGTQASGPTTTHHYANAGEYTITLSVADDTGASTTCSLNVRATGFPDANPPRVQALQSSGRIGAWTNLRFRILTPGSHWTRVRMTVYRDGRTVTSWVSMWAQLESGNRYWLRFVAPRTTASYRFCVRSSGAAGRWSAPSCAQLLLRR
jgi:hypothetical protein